MRTIKKLIILISLTMVLTSCKEKYGLVNVDTYREEIEKAYFEGQKDAINGDVRIRKNNDGCWVWTKSCWDGGDTPNSIRVLFVNNNL